MNMIHYIASHLTCELLLKAEGKVTYLGEALAVIEAEENGRKAILRSAPNHNDPRAAMIENPQDMEIS